MTSSTPILLVEDDDNDIFFFKRATELAGVENPLRIVKDGQEATDYLEGKGTFSDREQHPSPGVVVLDLNLPRKHGLEVLKWIRQSQHWSTIPIIILTSSNSEIDVTVAYRLGCNSYFVKPTDPDLLVELMRLLKDYWFRWCRLLPPPSS
jgi:Response regulators consisting of a CheY-like receiver domain and a winged-helix DNA-binding domain